MRPYRGSKWIEQLVQRSYHSNKLFSQKKGGQPSAVRKAKVISSRLMRRVTGKRLRPIVGIVLSARSVHRIRRWPPNSNINIYMDSAQRLGFTAYAFALPDASIHSRKVRAWVRRRGQWHQRTMPWPDVYYEQFWLAPTGYSRSVLKKLRRSAIPINSRNSLGKWLCYDILRHYPDTAALLPETTRFREPLDLSTMLDKYPTVFTKPEQGSGARGISVVRRRGIDSYDWLNPANGKSLQNLSFDQVLAKVVSTCRNTPFVIQQEIPLFTRDGRRGDIRVTMIKDGRGQWVPTVASGIRLAQPGVLVTNCVRGAEWLRFPDGLAQFIGERPGNEALLAKIMDASVLVLKRLEQALGPMGEVGLDLALDQDLGLWLLEANAKPSKEPNDYRPGGPIQDKHLLVMEYARYLWDRKKKVESRSTKASASKYEQNKQFNSRQRNK